VVALGLAVDGHTVAGGRNLTQNRSARFSRRFPFAPVAATAAACLLITFGARPFAQSAAISYLSYDEGTPVFDALGEAQPPRAEWLSWIAARDRETRARTTEGDETSIVNWLLFGTTFTNHPRITAGQIDSKEIGRALAGRIADLERALTGSGDSERIRFARQVLGAPATVRPRLGALLDRVMKEGETHARLVEQAKALGDPSLEFAERSRMYRARGLSTDTSLKVNFAIEEALRRLIPVIARGADPKMRRVAIIGPGLDFADKQEGYDFYAPQTIQPFALQDSLLRLGLATDVTPAVTAFDLSPRVNAHIEYAATRARNGAAYTIHLPIDGEVSWTKEFLDYWTRFGSDIGAVTPVSVPQGTGSLKVRAIAVRPAFAARLSAMDLNVTAQRLTLPEVEQFDLIVGTNIFLYYDRLQQALATMSVASMLKPGGILLSNNALVEVPAGGLRSIGYSRVLYSNREEDGDLIIWYQKPKS
jgi:hypothetical protein